MGYPDLSASFEYYDIVVSKIDSELRRHMDYKNDDRTNYNNTFVYSFVRDGYKVSIIMTTRRDVGSAMDKIQNEYRKENDRRVSDILN
jgi:hypothetical protein